MHIKLIIILSLIFLFRIPVLAMDDSEGYEGYFETVNEAVNTSSVMALVGQTADEMLYKIKDALIPGIVRLSNPEGSESGKYNIKIATPSSFIGTLISVLLTLECIVLGIKSFIGENHDGANLIRHFLLLCILLAFIALLPIIADSILHILVNAAVVVGKGDVSDKTIAFTPSSVIDLLESCKTIIDEKRASIGSLSLKRLSLLPDILALFFTSFVIAIPYIIICISVIFWYIEFYIIILAGVIALPFSFFSYTSVTDMKSILKALILVGMKVFLGVALGVLSTQVITEQLENNTFAIGGTINLIVYLVLMTVFFVFGVIKGPVIFMSALSGSSSVSSPKSLLTGRFSQHLKRPSDRSKSSKNNNDKNEITSNDDVKEKTENPAPVEINAAQSVQYPSKTLINKSDSKEISSNATAERMHIAYEKFQSEGVKYVSVERLKERARWEATYDKLSEMKENGFKDKNGRFNSAAAAQYARLVRDKGDYIKGNKTWDGVNKQ